MARNKDFHIRLTEFEFEKLQKESVIKGVSMADIVRDFIKSLPSAQKT